MPVLPARKKTVGLPLVKSRDTHQADSVIGFGPAVETMESASTRTLSRSIQLWRTLSASEVTSEGIPPVTGGGMNNMVENGTAATMLNTM